MKQSILQFAKDPAAWQTFLEYKTERQHLSVREQQEILTFLQREAYLPLCRAWEEERFPSTLPVRQIVNKEGTTKKRAVYTFEGDEGIFLKFIAFQLYRYDSVFSDNCYAFRRHYGIRDAVLKLTSESELASMYCLKADISNYFNSIDVTLLLEKLSFIRQEDVSLYQLFEKLLLEDRVMENGRMIHDRHGAMAGMPLSPFFANVYLKDVDQFFLQEQIPYFRYSDDILIFAADSEKLKVCQRLLEEQIRAHGLTMNPEKVHLYAPDEPVEFLGFSFQGSTVDLSANTVQKIKAKIRRKAHSLRRWQQKKGISEEKAAIGFIHAMNAKFFGAGNGDDFCWNRWFFPNLTTDRSLKEIDRYMQEYIRFCVTGRHYKGNYRIKYETMKQWGYQSLVHEYYRRGFRDDQKL